MGSAPFTSCDVAQETLLSEFDQHLTTASPRACGSSQLESDQQSSQLLSTSHKSGFALVELNAGTAGLKHSSSPISRPVLPILLNSSSFTGSEIREDHVPHVVFFEDTLFTHASFAHQCVFTSGTAGSGQVHPATRQAHTHIAGDS